MDTRRILCGIDIGGTSIKIGLFSPAGERLAFKQLPTTALDQAGSLALSAAVRAYAHDFGAVEALGVGIPGSVDRSGSVSFMPNACIDTPSLVQAFHGEFGHIPFALVNDANAAAFGEQWRGAAVGTDNVVLVTLGTGVGAGMVADGHMVYGHRGAAGEIGHICIEPNGRPCNCGARGCLEQYASARAVLRMANEALGSGGCAKGDGMGEGAIMPPGAQPSGQAHPFFADASDVFAAYEAFEGSESDKPAEAAPREADVAPVPDTAPATAASTAASDTATCAAAARAVSAFCDKLGFALAQIACTTSPELFLIGGGLSHFFACYSKTLHRSYASHAIPAFLDVPIKAATLGNEAGALGAARAAALQVYGKV